MELNNVVSYLQWDKNNGVYINFVIFKMYDHLFQVSQLKMILFSLHEM